MRVVTHLIWKCHAKAVKDRKARLDAIGLYSWLFGRPRWHHKFKATLGHIVSVALSQNKR